MSQFLATLFALPDAVWVLGAFNKKEGKNFKRPNFFDMMYFSVQ